MSQILRALSRGRRRGGERTDDRSRDDDAVLAGLGVRPGGTTRTAERRPMLWILAGLVLLALGGVVAANLLRNKAASENASLAPVSHERTSPVGGGIATPSLQGDAPVAGDSTPARRSDAPAVAAADSEDPPAKVPAALDQPDSPVRTAIERTDSAPARRTPSGRSERAATPPPPVATPPPAPAAAPDVDHSQLALYYHRAGDFENALSHYRALLKRNELNAEVHNNLGLLFRDKRLYDEAIKEFQRALYIDPKYVVARNNLSVTLLEAGRPDAAATELRIIVAAEPDNVDALVNLALALSAMKQDGAAQETLMQAIGIEPQHAAAHYNLARLYDEEREPGKALEHYRAFLKFAGAEHSGIVPEVNRRVAALQKKQDG